MYFFELDRPVGIAVVGAISVMHSVFHLPHCLMYRRFGILTAFWSAVGAGLIFGAIMEYETFYITWIWYSCIYVPIMLITMCVKLTHYIFELDIKPFRIFLGMVAVLFYMFMLYCVAFVYDEKLKVFSTTTVMMTTESCPTFPTLRSRPSDYPTKQPPSLNLPGILRLHSVFHLPHCLMYRRLGLLTFFWSVLGATLVYGAIIELEFFYALYVWYSCVYVPVMLITMSIKLATYIFELELKPYRVALGLISVCFYLFMLYCVIYVYDEKERLFFTTTTAPTTVTCPTAPSTTTTTTTTTSTTERVPTTISQNPLETKA